MDEMIPQNRPGPPLATQARNAGNEPHNCPLCAHRIHPAQREAMLPDGGYAHVACIAGPPPPPRSQPAGRRRAA